MEYSEFLQKFYLPNEGGGLVGYKSKKKIAMFFFEHGLDDNYNDSIICPSDSTYEKWETGARKPEGSIWGEVNRSFDERKLLKGLQNALSDRTIREVMERFDVALEAGEPPDKLQFAKAITAQFKAIAHGSGVAVNIVPEEYKKPPELIGFGTYLGEAKKTYRMMKLPGNEEYPLSKFFVCNNIGTSSAVFPHRIKGKYIEDATLLKIRKFDRRGEIRRAILIGSCGYGKTLMLQHLFLEAAGHAHETGMLPVFAELRDFSSRFNDLVSFLIDAVQRFDLSFTREKLISLLEKGQAQILIDGLDEMDTQETSFFQRKLADFCHHYPNNQVVISSRQCSAVNGIRGFNKLYIHPLDETQTQLLIDKLLSGIEDANAKETVMSFMSAKDGYIRRNGFVATNPMLMTVIVRHYEEIRDLAGNKSRFYELLYNALIRDHDEDKESFERFFHSVGNGDEFTQMFREFCALAYMDGVFEFDHRAFEKYYRGLKSRDTLMNPQRFQLSAFQHDVCATACMMYEQESGIYYIDPGFQDYFFADYYYLEETESTKAMGRALWNRKINSFRNLNALKMFYEIAKEKVEVCILLPYLESIFKGKTDEEAFLRYLSYGYGCITYSLLDEPTINQYMNTPRRAEKFDIAPEANTPKNIIMGLLFDILDLPNAFVIGAMDEKVQPNDSTIRFIDGYYDARIDPANGDGSNNWLRAESHDIAYLSESYLFQDMASNPFPITDESGRAVILGYVYQVDPLTLLEKPEQQGEIRELCKAAHVMETYERVKEYYQKIADKQKTNEYR